MKIYDDIIKEINKIIHTADENKSEIKLSIIASVKDKTVNYDDYHEHSVSTSYLSLATLNELLGYFQEYDVYTTIDFDIEEFLKRFYTQENKIRPNIIFETSPKGIGRGKDALIPCLCDIWGIKHLGPSANITCLCSSKYQWGSILKSHNIPTPTSHFYTNHTWNTMPEIGVKYLLKLNYECASIGLSNDSVIINDGTNLIEFSERLSERYYQGIIAQEFIDGYEVEVPVLINHNSTIVLPPVGLSFRKSKLLDSEFLNYDTIYCDNYDFYDFSSVSEQISEEIRNCVYKISNVLDLNGYMRVDFRVKPNGDFYVIDINNDPCINTNGSFLYSLSLLGYENSTIAPILLGNCIT